MLFRGNVSEKMAKYQSTLVLFGGTVIGIDISFRRGFLWTLVDVGLDVKVGKQQEEQGSMEQNDVAEYFWEVTVNEQGETGMNEECHKLDHL